MILVDISVWIDYFNNNNNEKVQMLEDFFRQGKDIYITDIILTEILQGIKDDAKYLIVKNSILSLKFAHAKDYETFIHASDIYRKCRKNGYTIRKSIDCLIAAISIENNLLLLNNDKDFISIKKCTNLEIL